MQLFSAATFDCVCFGEVISEEEKRSETATRNLSSEAKSLKVTVIDFFLERKNLSYKL
jgi:hypothetical protein